MAMIFLKLFIQESLLIINNAGCWKILGAYRLLYLFQPPHRIAKKELKEAYDPSFTYGETPLKVFEIMASYLKPQDTLCDLGCGGARGLFYLAKSFNIHGVGVEFLGGFIENGLFLKNYFGLDNIEFVHSDLKDFKVPYFEGIFVAGTCFSDELLEILAKQIQNTKPKYVFSISSSLLDYGLKGYTLEEKEILMPFGKTTLFIHCGC